MNAVSKQSCDRMNAICFVDTNFKQIGNFQCKYFVFKIRKYSIYLMFLANNNNANNLLLTMVLVESNSTIKCSCIEHKYAQVICNKSSCASRNSAKGCWISAGISSFLKKFTTHHQYTELDLTTYPKIHRQLLFDRKPKNIFLIQGVNLNLLQKIIQI